MKSKALKGVLSLIFIYGFLSCTTTLPQGSTIERQAKSLTEQMERTLQLSADQREKVLAVNVVNMGLKAKIKEVISLKEVEDKYRKEMKIILTDSQYKLFVDNFLNTEKI